MLHEIDLTGKSETEIHAMIEEAKKKCKSDNLVDILFAMQEEEEKDVASLRIRQARTGLTHAGGGKRKRF